MYFILFIAQYLMGLCMSWVLLCLGVKFWLNQNQEHFLLHKMVLELQEEDMR